MRQGQGGRGCRGHVCECVSLTAVPRPLCRIYVLTFSDGGVVANFADLTPDIPYPTVSTDTSFTAVSNGSFPIGSTPAWTNPLDDVTAFVNNVNDVWGLTVFTTFNTTRECSTLWGQRRRA